MKKSIVWIPRTLAILLTLFISIFALDAFEDPQWFLALIIHLIPTYVLILITVLAWKKERLGGILFIILALLFVVFFRNLIFPPVLLLIGILFLVSDKKRSEAR